MTMQYNNYVTVYCMIIYSSSIILEYVLYGGLYDAMVAVYSCNIYIKGVVSPAGLSLLYYRVRAVDYWERPGEYSDAILCSEC